LEFNERAASGQAASNPGALFEWVKFRSHLSRGVTIGTALQDDAFFFTQLGTFLERADNTARILDVRFADVEPNSRDAARQ
ncbi:alpha-E domain-containing protein, partial [Burkholderia sp. SIMBA_048]